MTLPVAILAGGLGTRVRHLSGPDVPKALLPVNGTPFIDLKLGELRAWGVSRVLMLVGHNAKALVEHVGDGGRFGIDVEWFDDGRTLRGTGGAIRRALRQLPEVFWVTYGDSLLDVPMAAIEADFCPRTAALAGMTVLENQDRWEPSNVTVTEGLVTDYVKGAAPGTHRFIDYGAILMRRQLLDSEPEDRVFDLSEVLSAAAAARTVRAYPVNRRFYDIGTEQSLRSTEAELARSTETS